MIHCGYYRWVSVFQSSSLLQVGWLEAGINLGDYAVSILQNYSVFSNSFNTLALLKLGILFYIRIDELFDKKLSRITSSTNLSYLINSKANGKSIFHKLDYNIVTQSFLHSTIHEIGSSNVDSFEFILSQKFPSFKHITYLTINETNILAC